MQLEIEGLAGLDGVDDEGGGLAGPGRCSCKVKGADRRLFESMTRDLQKLRLASTYWKAMFQRSQGPSAELDAIIVAARDQMVQMAMEF